MDLINAINDIVKLINDNKIKSAAKLSNDWYNWSGRTFNTSSETAAITNPSRKSTCARY
jgi:hypothetical protein